MIKVNKEMKWEEACKLYHDKKALFKILTATEHQCLKFPKDVFVESVSETEQDIKSLRKELINRGLYCTDLMEFPKDAYSITVTDLVTPLFV